MCGNLLILKPILSTYFHQKFFLFLKVDTFFVLSGLLVSTKLLNHFDRLFWLPSINEGLLTKLNQFGKSQNLNQYHFVAEKRVWIFHCFTCIASFDWHRFLVYQFCFQCLCCDFSAAVHSCPRCCTFHTVNVNAIGGQHCCSSKISWIIMKWRVFFSF